MTARLAIIGSYPPPFGGVAVHVQRLGALLDAAGVDYVVYNATSDAGDNRRVFGVYSRRRTWLIRYLLTTRDPVLYMMSGRLSAWVLSALTAAWRGKRVLLRLRNSSLIDWMSQPGLKRFWCRYALRRMAAVVCVSRELAEAARAAGVPSDRIHYAPGFLPPARPDDRADVNPAVWEFIEQHHPVIAANGKVDAYKGVDLYALDHLVELAARLKPDHPNLGIVVCFWEHTPQDQPRLDDLIRRAKELGVTENIFFNTRSGVFVPVLNQADVFVRPTNTDGDANSIREALYLGVPAVASDVVERPPGAVLFRTRDLNDFERAVRTALASASSRAERPPPKLADDDQRRIQQYVRLLAGLAGSRADRPGDRNLNS